MKSPHEKALRKRVVMSGRIEGGHHKEGLNELKKFSKERGSTEAEHRGGHFKFKKESLGNMSMSDAMTKGLKGKKHFS